MTTAQLKTGAAVELQNAVSTAMSTFMKAANHALSTVEEGSKDALKRATQENREIQRERDELRREREVLMKEKLAMAVEIETLKGEMERCRTANDKAEWMINHQTETISQLRKEAQQWKDQFMRVDEERLRLSSRNDELMSHQLHANRRESRPQEPLTPRSQGPHANRSTTSATRETPARTKTNTSKNATGYLTDGDSLLNRRRTMYANPTSKLPKTSAPRKSLGKTNVNAVAGPSREALSTSKSAPVQTKLLGTYHIVMQGAPIKDEHTDIDVSQLGYESPTERHESKEKTPIEDDRTAPPLVRGRRRVSSGGNNTVVRKASTSRRRWAEERRIRDDDDEEESGSVYDEPGSGDESEEYIPPKSSRMGVIPDDDDDDELRIGGTEDRRGNVEPQVIVPLTGRRRAQAQPAKQKLTATPKARKRNSPYPTTSTGKKPRR